MRLIVRRIWADIRGSGGEGHAEQAKQEMEDTEDRYRNLLEDIMG